jgi:very-short-patch-repair endonuclease
VDDSRGRPRDDESLDGRIAALAASQHGAFSRGQALAAGLTARQMRHRVEAGRWMEPLRGAYVIAGSYVDARHAAMVAALWAGEGSVVSHATAGALWGFEGVRARRIEIWTPRALKSEAVVVHRGTRIDRADRTTLGPIPITTPARTLIDVAARFDSTALAGLLERTIGQGLVDAERLRARLQSLRSSGRPGAGRLAGILAERGSGPVMESTLEALVWSILVRSGLRLPERQVWVATSRGRYRLDFAWPDVEVALECDGYEHHGSTRERFGKDRARYAELVAAGYRVVPVTWDIARNDPDRVIRWLRATITRAA